LNTVRAELAQVRAFVRDRANTHAQRLDATRAKVGARSALARDSAPLVNSPPRAGQLIAGAWSRKPRIGC